MYVASLIEKYLRSHPDAMDSFDGIRTWWITQQKIQESANSVSFALDLLIKKGVVVKVNEDLYRCSAKKSFLH